MKLNFKYRKGVIMKVFKEFDLTNTEDMNLLNNILQIGDIQSKIIELNSLVEKKNKEIEEMKDKCNKIQFPPEGCDALNQEIFVLGKIISGIYEFLSKKDIDTIYFPYADAAKDFLIDLMKKSGLNRYND